MKQVLSVEPTYERIQSIWVSEFALRDITFGEFLNIPVVTQEFSGVVFIFFFSFEKEELGEGVRLFFRTNLLFFDLHNSEVLSNLLFKHI